MLNCLETDLQGHFYTQCLDQTCNDSALYISNFSSTIIVSLVYLLYRILLACSISIKIMISEFISVVIGLVSMFLRCFLISFSFLITCSFSKQRTLILNSCNFIYAIPLTLTQNASRCLLASYHISLGCNYELDQITFVAGTHRLVGQSQNQYSYKSPFMDSIFDVPYLKFYSTFLIIAYNKFHLTSA